MSHFFLGTSCIINNFTILFIGYHQNANCSLSRQETFYSLDMNMSTL